MSFTDIKTKSQGFTIVELLIVVVVIAILAAITIVSYTGITNRANAATAQETASNLQKKVETYAADSTVGNYPTSLSALTAAGNSWTTPVMWGTNNPVVTASTPANQVQYLVCGRANSGTSPVAAPSNLAGITVVTGARVAYWNYGSPAAVAYNDSGVVNPNNTGSGTNVTVNSVQYGVACYAPTS